MRDSKIILSAVLSLNVIVGGAAAASAADLAARPYTKAPAFAPAVYDWTGGYIGIEGGGGWGHSNQTDPGVPQPPPTEILIDEDGHYSVRGGLLGVTLGHNSQQGALVFGWEGDFSWSDIKGRSEVCGPLTVAPHPCGARLDALGTFRTRAGLPRARTATGYSMRPAVSRLANSTAGMR